MKGDIKRIVKILQNEGVKKALLFGSSVYKVKSGDIDIAIDKYPRERFFDIYGKLIMGVKKPVDLIDLAMIRKENKIFYKLLLSNSKVLI